MLSFLQGDPFTGILYPVNDLLPEMSRDLPFPFQSSRRPNYGLETAVVTLTLGERLTGKVHPC